MDYIMEVSVPMEYEDSNFKMHKKTVRVNVLVRDGDNEIEIEDNVNKVATGFVEWLLSIEEITFNWIGSDGNWRIIRKIG